METIPENGMRPARCQSRVDVPPGLVDERLRTLAHESREHFRGQQEARATEPDALWLRDAVSVGYSPGIDFGDRQESRPALHQIR